MTTITSRRHIFKFYVAIIAGALFFLGMGVFLIFVFMRRSDQGLTDPADYLMLILAIGVLFMAVYTIIQYHKNAPKIIVDDNFISFNTETFSLTEIKKSTSYRQTSFPLCS